VRKAIAQQRTDTLSGRFIEHCRSPETRARASQVARKHGLLR
jgi:hypothetical protein